MRRSSLVLVMALLLAGCARTAPPPAPAAEAEGISWTGETPAEGGYVLYLLRTYAGSADMSAAITFHAVGDPRAEDEWLVVFTGAMERPREQMFDIDGASIERRYGELSQILEPYTGRGELSPTTPFFVLVVASTAVKVHVDPTLDGAGSSLALEAQGFVGGARVTDEIMPPTSGVAEPWRMPTQLDSPGSEILVVGIDVDVPGTWRYDLAWTTADGETQTDVASGVMMPAAALFDVRRIAQRPYVAWCQPAGVGEVALSNYTGAGVRPHPFHFALAEDPWERAGWPCP